ncbi:hypothetical protein [Georgenia deserti]|uniref:SMODS-associating 2TM beta-strand rich effector domain-containing protein n=1 Tax=Georgenia deserti TaxID=2093781 RepID=A0ABW4L841_9MICO
MDRYPSPVDSTRDTAVRRIAEYVFTAGVSVSFTLALVAGERDLVGLWITCVLTVVALIVILCDEGRLRRLDARAWSTDQWHYLRENEYRRRQGVFLTHSVTPAPGRSDDNRKWWTARVHLTQHGSGPLSDSKIKEVEYSFGPQFTEGPVKAQHPHDNFGHETVLYGPLLVLGRVVFTNPLKRPLIVERYIDLPQ